jgi:hypothetical protein
VSIPLSYDGTHQAGGTDEPPRLVRRLRLREQLHFVRIATLFTLGAPVCFVGPFFVTCMLIGLGVGWWRLFTDCSAVVIPLLFLYVHLTRGRTILDLIRDLRGGNALETLAEREQEAEAVHVFFLLEVMAIGPRAMLRAARELVARARLRHVPLGQVAHTVRLLLPYERGVPTAELAAKTDDIRGTLDAVIYLVFHGWAELSTNRRRVWIAPHRREALAAMLAEWKGSSDGAHVLPRA